MSNLHWHHLPAGTRHPSSCSFFFLLWRPFKEPLVAISDGSNGNISLSISFSIWLPTCKRRSGVFFLIFGIPFEMSCYAALLVHTLMEQVYARPIKKDDGITFLGFLGEFLEDRRLDAQLYSVFLKWKCKIESNGVSPTDSL